MVEYSEVRDIVHEILHSDYDVFYQDGDVLRFRGDDIYNPRVIPGPQGVPGPKGSDGISPTIDIYVTVDNESSNNPTCQVTKNVTNGGTVCKYTLNFHGLKGIQGSQGLQGVKGEDGEGIDFNPNELISHVESLIDSEESRIRSLIDNLDQEIKGDVIAMVDEAQFWQQHLPQNIISGNSNFGQNDVKEYLQQLGLWETSNGATYTKWSSIHQTVDSIRTEVNQLKQNGINYESLSSSLYNYISENQANAGMQTTWSKFMQLDNGDMQMLKWMSSGMRSQASNESAVAELFSAVKDTQSTIEAYSGLSTRIEQLEDGNYVSTASLTSYVQNAINTSMAGVITESTLEHAIATMYSRVNDNLAGVITESTLDGAITELFAKNSSTKSSISTYVNGKISNIDLKADEVNIISNGKTVAEIKNNGRCYFNEGRVYIPTIAYGMNGERDNNVSGLIIKEISNGAETGTKAYYQGSSFSTQSSNGIIYGSINCGSNRILELNSYLSSTNNYAQKLTFAINCRDSSTNAPRIQAYTQSALENATGSKGTFETNMNLIVSNNINYTGTCSQLSDENIKEIVNYINPLIEDIADVRIVNYELKFNKGTVYSGTIAQDWQNILPNVVTVNPENETLGLDYSATALISSVTAAREIVKLKQENEELKQRLSILEEKLDNYLK